MPGHVLPRHILPLMPRLGRPDLVSSPEPPHLGRFGELPGVRSELPLPAKRSAGHQTGRKRQKTKDLRNGWQVRGGLAHGRGRGAFPEDRGYKGGAGRGGGPRRGRGQQAPRRAGGPRKLDKSCRVRHTASVAEVPTELLA